MCCYISEYNTNQFKKKYNKNTKVSVYKILTHDNKTIWMDVPVTGGYFIADKDKPTIVKFSCGKDGVYGGAIHVYLYKEDADESNWEPGQKTIKCWAYSKDIIAVSSHDEACFSKIFIPKAELRG